MEMEAETGVKHLQVEDNQELLMSLGARRKAWTRLSPRPLEGINAAEALILDSWPPEL